jgi:hypothetical protein
MSKKEISKEVKAKSVEQLKEYLFGAAIGQIGYAFLKNLPSLGKYDENDKMADEEMDRICMQSIHTSTWVVTRLREMRENVLKCYGENDPEIKNLNVMIAQAAYESSMLAHEYGYKGQCYNV